MRPPLLLTVPFNQLDARSRRIFSVLRAAGLLLILGGAAWARFVWPQWPVSDSDTWGYLHPGLAQLGGQGFIHTYGRNFLYPGWVYLLLRGFGDFRAIPVAQHLLGLATGGLLWVSWRQWREWFRASRLPAWADAALELALVVFFLRSGSVIYYESQVRPEAVFPFFAALDLCLLLAFLRAWIVDRHPTRSAWLGGGCVVAAVLLYQLKPSFGLAVGFALLPLAWAWLHPWTPAVLPRWRLAVGTGVGAVLAVLLFLLPERHFARQDAFATIFLPETLLTVHADLVRDQLVRDARENAVTPFPAAFLAEAADRMDRETTRAAQPPRKPYPTLGFDPDHLMYGHDSFCHWLNEQRAAPEAAAFCFYYYRRAALHQPGRLATKVLRQLGLYYSLHCPAFWPVLRFKAERLYRKTNVALAYPNYQQELRAYPPGAAYLDAAARLQQSGAQYQHPKWTARANVAAAVCYLPLLALFAAGMAWVSRWPAERRAGLWAGGWLLAMVYGLNFGNCLTISIVHSLDLARYSYNLFVYAAWCEVAAVAWLIELGRTWVETDSPRTETRILPKFPRAA